MDIRHRQTVTPIKTDNFTSDGFLNPKMNPKGSKTWGVRYHCLRDLETLKQLQLCWDKRSNNYDDYFTKHHPPLHHQKMKPRYVHSKKKQNYQNIKNIPRILRLY